MRTVSNTAHRNSSVGSTRKALIKAGARLVTDSKDFAKVGKRGIKTFVKSPPFIAGAIAFAVGGILVYIMKRK